MWRLAGEVGDRAFDQLPDLLPDASTRGIGYYQALMSPVAENSESPGGSNFEQWKTDPKLINRIVARPWHEQLRARFAKMPRPTYLRTCILECPKCSRWRHASSADPSWNPCDCDAVGVRASSDS